MHPYQQPVSSARKAERTGVLLRAMAGGAQDIIHTGQFRGEDHPSGRALPQGALHASARLSVALLTLRGFLFFNFSPSFFLSPLRTDQKVEFNSVIVRNRVPCICTRTLYPEK